MAVGSRVIVLDESGKQKGHALLSVGGFVADLADVLEIESRWREAKAGLGIDPDQPVKYSGDWPDRSKRTALIEEIGTLSIVGVIALLEDFRPKRMLLSKDTRSDRYVHLRAFDYVLQRVVRDLYLREASGPHLVYFDERSDLDEFAKHYAAQYDKDWRFPSGPALPSLASRGFARTLGGAYSGPLVEIADMITSAMSRWATARCAAHKGVKGVELEELDRTCAALAPLFPDSGQGGVPPRRRGYSIVTHAKGIKEGELLRDHIDRWISDVLAPATGVESSRSG